MQPITTSSISTEYRSPVEKKFNAQAALSKGNLAYLRTPRPVKDIKIQDHARPPATKLKKLLDHDWRFRRSWQRTDRASSQISSSAHEHVLALFAARSGWTDQEIADLVVAARRNHNQPASDKQVLGNDIKKILETTHKQIAKEQALKEVSKQFAGVFIGQFLQAMRKTVKTGKFGFGGKEEQTFQSMLDDEFANQAAGGETYGLSRLIYQSLARSSNVPAGGVMPMPVKQVNAAYMSAAATAEPETKQ